MKKNTIIILLFSACVYSQKNELDKSKYHLKRALMLGYNDFEWIKEDPDLTNLRNAIN